VDCGWADERTGPAVAVGEPTKVTRVFRHTWTAARFQTLDRGAPVSLYSVARELGHGSEQCAQGVRPPGTIPHRFEVVSDSCSSPELLPRRLDQSPSWWQVYSSKVWSDTGLQRFAAPGNTRARFSLLVS